MVVDLKDIHLGHRRPADIEVLFQHDPKWLAQGKLRLLVSETKLVSESFASTYGWAPKVDARLYEINPIEFLTQTGETYRLNAATGRQDGGQDLVVFIGVIESALLVERAELFDTHAPEPALWKSSEW